MGLLWNSTAKITAINFLENWLAFKKKSSNRVEEMMQRLSELVGLLEDKGSILSIHMTTHNESEVLLTSITGETDALFWPQCVLHACGTYAYRQANSHIHKIKKINLFFKFKYTFTQ